MVKSKEIIKEVKQYEYSFYCDECGEYLGTSTQFDNNWYQAFGELKLEIYINGWYRVEKHLCYNCKNKFIEKLKSDLYKLGFKRD